MRFFGLLFAVSLVMLGQGCSTASGPQLDDDARDRLASLTPRLERLPPDLGALEESVAIYAEHERFLDAADTIDGFLGRASLEPAALARAATIYARLAREAERALGNRKGGASDAATVVVPRARAVAALTSYRASHDHGPVDANVTLRGGTAQRLLDVMLECTSHDFDPEGAGAGPLSVSFFGDRLRLDGSDSSSRQALEARLGEIAVLIVERDPMGRVRVRVDPQPWSRETAACDACALPDACTLVGDRAGKQGLARVGLAELSEVRFDVEPGS